MIIHKKWLAVFLCVAVLLCGYNIAKNIREASLEKQLLQEVPLLTGMLERARNGETEGILLDELAQNGLDHFFGLRYYSDWDGLYLQTRDWGILGNEGYLITPNAQFSIAPGHGILSEEVWHTEGIHLYKISFSFD